jgi:hypothetical protein
LRHKIKHVSQSWSCNNYESCTIILKVQIKSWMSVQLFMRNCARHKLAPQRHAKIFPFLQRMRCRRAAIMARRIIDPQLKLLNPIIRVNLKLRQLMQAALHFNNQADIYSTGWLGSACKVNYKENNCSVTC